MNHQVNYFVDMGIYQMLPLIVSGPIGPGNTRPWSTKMYAVVDEDLLVMCAVCGWELFPHEVEQFDDECAKCHAKRHFTCVVCTDQLEKVDECKAHPGHCESCGEAIDVERVDALKDALTAAIEEVLDQDNEGRIKRVLAAVKAIR
jgi:hypothetical protein